MDNITKDVLNELDPLTIEQALDIIGQATISGKLYKSNNGRLRSVNINSDIGSGAYIICDISMIVVVR